jgi:hypothetical protein
VIACTTGHCDGLEAIELVPLILSLGPVKELIARHARLLASDAHVGKTNTISGSVSSPKTASPRGGLGPSQVRQE